MPINVAQPGLGFGAGTGTPPAAPTFTATNGTAQVTITIDGTAGLTHRVLYKTGIDSSWHSGGSRVGDGAVVVTGLANDTPYIFTVYSEDSGGLYSTPAPALFVRLTGTDENHLDPETEDTADEFLDVFGEVVTYVPAGGGEREIRGIVDRELTMELPGERSIHAPICFIYVANDSTDGISSSEIDTKADKIEFPLRAGDTVTQQRRITKIFEQDHGLLRLEIR